MGSMGIKPAYGTHVPVMYRLLGLTDGPVLELGMGYFSTPFLHWVCLSQNRLLVSYDNDPKFFGQFYRFEHTCHQIHLVKDWDDAAIERPWDIVLVDHSPAGRRSIEAMRLAHYAKYIILHDTYWKQEHHYHYYQIYPLFQYRWDYEQFHPTYATIVSNFIDLTDFHL